MMLADLHTTTCIVDSRGVSMCAERIHEGAGCCLNGFFRASCRHNILKDGGDVDYVGVTNVELIGPGEAAGTYREYVVEGGEFKTVGYR